MAIAPKFNAIIDADISKFMKKAATVNKTIQKMASEVIVDIGANITDFMANAATVEREIENLDRGTEVTIRGDVSNLQQAIAEANAGLAGLNNDSTININGNSSNFDNAVRNVNRQTNTLSRRVTEARIGADISPFEDRMVEVVRALTAADDTVTPRIEADINSFMRDITKVQDRMREVARSSASPEVEADIAGFMAQIAVVEAQLNAVADRHDVDIDADIGGFLRGAAIVSARARELGRNRIYVPVRLALNNYKNTMGQIANFSRSVGEVVSITARGGLIAISPAAVPVISSLVALLGQLGPLVGTVAGSTFALGSSFVTAGIGAAAFGAIAVTNLKAIFDESAKLNAEQQKGRDALDGFKKTWSDIAGSFQSETISIFTDSLNIMGGVLVTLKPMFAGVMDAVQGLTDSLGKSIDAPPMQAFFEYLNTTAGPMLENIGKAAGNFIQGFLNMMTAFGPLATDTTNGFLKMSEGFAKWSDGLSKSEKFQSFVDYVKENMPKVRSIFSDAIQGIINLFAGFGGSSSDMMTSLQDMMERFKEWSSTISQNQGFQNFIDYVKTNGPVVVDTIGEIVTFIVNLGKAMAPIGEQILGLVNSLVEWTNGMLEAHPWLGKIAAGAVVLGGALMMMAPAFLIANSMFGKLIIKMTIATAKTLVTAAIFVAKWAWMGAQALIQGARMAAAWVLAMGPIGWVIVAIAALAIIIYKYWDEISAWTAKAWTAVSTAVTAAVDKIMSWIEEKFPALYTVIQTYMTMAKEVLSSIWELIKGTFSNALAWLKALVTGDFQGMKDAASNQMTLMKDKISEIWGIIKEKMGIILTAIKDKVKEKFLEMANKVASQLSLLELTMLKKWIEMKTKTAIKVDEMKEKVAETFTKIKEKVKEKLSEAKEALSQKWEEAKSATVTKLGQLISSVAKFFGDLVEKVRTKMSEAVKAVGEFIGQMPGKVTSFVGEMVSAGASLVGGVISGIKSKITEGLGVIGGLATSLISRFKKDTDTHSPSRAFADVSRWFVPGIVKGIDQTSHLAINSISGMATNIVSEMINTMAPNKFADIGANSAEGITDGTSEKTQSLSAGIKDKASNLLNVFVPKLEVVIL